MLSKNFCMTYWLSNSVVLILKYQVLVTKTQYDSEKRSPEKKTEGVGKNISITSRLIKKTSYNTKIRKIENKITSIARLVIIVLNTKATEIKNKIPKITK